MSKLPLSKDFSLAMWFISFAMLLSVVLAVHPNENNNANLRAGRTVARNEPSAEEIAALYANHENAQIHHSFSGHSYVTFSAAPVARLTPA